MSDNTETPEAHPPAPSVQERVAKLLSMANAISERLTPEQRTIGIGGELYDERGLPK